MVSVNMAPSIERSMLIVLLWSCADTPAPDAPRSCGDGVLDADEACDDGAANSDADPDACRTDCLAAGCGDGVIDAAEACDDAERWGGDGCDPDCGVESGTLETEPNPEWDEATPAGPTVHGSLTTGDADCWSFAVATCAAIEIREQAPCATSLALALHDPDGALLAVGAPGDDGCATLDPADQPGARWVREGTWSVCASAVMAAEIRGYALSIATGDATGLEPVGGDVDDDGTPDTCDADDDGDGVLDGDDNCPEVSNGPDTPPASLSADGFVRHWLGAGPFTTGVTTGECRPSDDALVGEDAAIAPAVGDGPWRARVLDGDLFDLLDAYGSVPAPREAYALVYLRSDAARSLSLAVGADDGVFAWWNGARVLDVAGCQGTTADQFTAPVEVAAGWNTLLLKVRDAGGGWSVMARFKDGDGAVVTDLEPSLSAGESWDPGQADADADGTGDACDTAP